MVQHPILLAVAQKMGFSPDPRNPDQDMFVMPFGGAMSSVFGDDSNTRISPRGYVQGVNLLGQGFVPGPNPIVGFAISKYYQMDNLLSG